MKKGKRDFSCSYVGIDRATILRSEAWRVLSIRGKLFYLTLKAKHNGTNNGALELHFSELAKHPGFNSRRAFYAAAGELEASGWIKRTNPGGFRNPNRYQLTGRHERFGL